MNSYNFTEQVRRTLALAREHAHELRHEYVGTEHILLGLLDDDGIATTVIESSGADPDHIAQLVLTTVVRGKTKQNNPELPYTSRAKKTLELTMSEARELNHSYVGTEHLLLGLLREGKGIAAQALNSVGITLDSARWETLRVLGIPADDTSPEPTALPLRSSTPAGKPSEVIVVLRYPNGDSRTQKFKSAKDAIRYIGESDAEPS